MNSQEIDYLSESFLSSKKSVKTFDVLTLANEYGSSVDLFSEKFPKIHEYSKIANEGRQKYPLNHIQKIKKIILQNRIREDNFHDLAIVINYSKQPEKEIDDLIEKTYLNGKSIFIRTIPFTQKSSSLLGLIKKRMIQKKELLSDYLYAIHYDVSEVNSFLKEKDNFLKQFSTHLNQSEILSVIDEFEKVSKLNESYMYTSLSKGKMSFYTSNLPDSKFVTKAELLYLYDKGYAMELLEKYLREEGFEHLQPTLVNYILLTQKIDPISKKLKSIKEYIKVRLKSQNENRSKRAHLLLEKAFPCETLFWYD